MASSKKLEMIYYNGQPDGIRSIRRHLSTMTTYVIPRPLLSDAKKISGINRPGIYYLINENDENRIAQIYIGQTRNGISRLDDHNRQKDFWNKAIMFLADSKTFSLDIISGLEEYAIVKAHESKRYSVENSVKPQYEIDEYQAIWITRISFIQRGMESEHLESMTAKNLKCLTARRSTWTSLPIWKDTIANAPIYSKRVPFLLLMGSTFYMLR